jgi:hypothetical protein
VNSDKYFWILYTEKDRRCQEEISNLPQQPAIISLVFLGAGFRIFLHPSGIWAPCPDKRPSVSPKKKAIPL